MEEEAVPKSVIRKFFKDIMDDPSVTTEEKLKAADLLAKLEGYIGSGAGRKPEARVGVMIVQHSRVDRVPGKVVEGIGGPKP